ncbi:MAG: cytochrome c4 [Gammaproteobacteria bacterium]|nr:cytochrome c4 [Gammaproteobacteria bacterium]
MRRTSQKDNHQGNKRFAIIISLLLAMLMPVSQATAAGDAEQGKAKAGTCAACHGADGNSVNPEWPSLAGQHPDYLVAALKSFKNGSRANVLMAGQAAGLDEQTMEDLAAYFASQKAAKRTADPALVDQGARIYRGGDIEKGISACMACHGPSGRGNPGAGYPILAGQHATYTANQLKAYRSGERQTDASMNQIMRNIAAEMSDGDINAVAAYIQGLQ